MSEACKAFQWPSRSRMLQEAYKEMCKLKELQSDAGACERHL